MARAKTQIDRLQLTIDLRTRAFLELLATKGTHGRTYLDVARTLIEHGIREALERGHLSQSDRDAVQREEK